MTLTPQVKKYLTIGAILAGLFAIYWFFIKGKTASATTDKNTAVQPTGTASGTTKTTGTKSTAALGNAEFPLKQGSKGQQVLHVQAYLNIIKGEKLVLDGIFGPATEAAITRAYPLSNKQISWAIYTSIYNINRLQILHYLRAQNWQLV